MSRVSADNERGEEEAEGRFLLQQRRRGGGRRVIRDARFRARFLRRHAAAAAGMCICMCVLARSLNPTRRTVTRGYTSWGWR